MAHEMMRWFEYKHLPERLQETSKQFFLIAEYVDGNLPDCAEKSAALRKILEAKDCAVRARLCEGELKAKKVVVNGASEAEGVTYPLDQKPEPIPLKKMVDPLGIRAPSAVEIAKQLEHVKTITPVDRTQRTLTDGSPVTDDHREIQANGQQKGYVVLSEEERKKGFVRPVRRSYVHDKCGSITTMGLALCETYARDPKFYSATFCSTCGTHYPVAQFKWHGTEDRVGS